jgi:hypothetical protein
MTVGGNDPMAEKYTAFRAAFWILFLYVNLWSGAGVLAITFIPAALSSPPGNWTVLLTAQAMGLAIGSVLTTVGVVPLMLYFRTYAGPDTLKCTDVFARYVTVRWDSIHRVRPINMGGLRYLRLKSDEAKREIWLPLYLADPRGFTEFVAEYAGEDHPLTCELRRRFPTEDDDYSPSHGARA